MSPCFGGFVPRCLETRWATLNWCFARLNTRWTKNLWPQISNKRRSKQILARIRGHLADLATALERVANACVKGKIKIISKSVIWWNEKTLSDDHHLALSTRMDQQQRNLSNDLDTLKKLMLGERLQDSSCPDEKSGPFVKQTNTQAIRIATSHRIPCREWCPCACHATQKLKLNAPGMMKSVLDKLFLCYFGFPVSTNHATLEIAKIDKTSLLSWNTDFLSDLHRWSWSCFLRICRVRCLKFQLSLTRRVSDDSSQYHWQCKKISTMYNTYSVKAWSAQGTWATLEVYLVASKYTVWYCENILLSLILVSAYDDMHDHEIVQFLINQEYV